MPLGRHNIGLYRNSIPMNDPEYKIMMKVMGFIKRNVKQCQLIKELGFSCASVYSWYNGGRTPNVQSYQKIKTWVSKNHPEVLTESNS